MKSIKVILLLVVVAVIFVAGVVYGEFSTSYNLGSDRTSPGHYTIFHPDGKIEQGYNPPQSGEITMVSMVGRGRYNGKDGVVTYFNHPWEATSDGSSRTMGPGTYFLSDKGGGYEYIGPEDLKYYLGNGTIEPLGPVETIDQADTDSLRLQTMIGNIGTPVPSEAGNETDSLTKEYILELFERLNRGETEALREFNDLLSKAQSSGNGFSMSMQPNEHGGFDIITEGDPTPLWPFALSVIMKNGGYTEQIKELKRIFIEDVKDRVILELQNPDLSEDDKATLKEAFNLLTSGDADKITQAEELLKGYDFYDSRRQQLEEELKAMAKELYDKFKNPPIGNNLFSLVDYNGASGTAEEGPLTNLSLFIMIGFLEVFGFGDNVMPFDKFYSDFLNKANQIKI